MEMNKQVAFDYWVDLLTHSYFKFLVNRAKTSNMTYRYAIILFLFLVTVALVWLSIGLKTGRQQNVWIFVADNQTM